jgi:hypothetical protein
MFVLPAFSNNYTYFLISLSEEHPFFDQQKKGCKETDPEKPSLPSLNSDFQGATDAAYAIRRCNSIALKPSFIT